jgi:succinate dehydrogenase / fumarate reductase, flavoprotein subunit
VGCGPTITARPTAAWSRARRQPDHEHPGLYAIGECDYQYHGANRLGANSLLSCIFSGLFVAPGIENHLKTLKGGAAADQRSSLYENAVQKHQERHNALLRGTGGKENPYLIHQELGT